MARYTLILKDLTYFKLMKIAIENNLSFGKLINKILEEYIENYEKGK